MSDTATHWNAIYRSKDPTQVSWYQPHLARSLDLIARTGVGPDAHLIDVGGGASTLVDDLLMQEFRHLTVLDVSSKALGVSRARLGQQADAVTWNNSDITAAQLPRAYYDLWHDRAVFHFLTNAEDRRHYVATMREALKPGGHAILATFALQGPPRCSGLEVIRYSPDALHAELDGDFRLIEALDEAHQTPFHTVQQFMYCRFQRRMLAIGSE